MKELKEYTIPFVGLKLGEHRFNYEVDNTFFANFNFEDFNSAAIDLEIILTKKTTLLEFTLLFKGSVNVNCDVTNEAYNQNISGEYNFVVKFGEAFNDENDELLIIPHGSHQVNIQQYVYETLVLAVPIKKTHPDLEKGLLKSEILSKLEELSPNKKKTTEKEIDPRWDTLKKLLTDKK
jgi:uncharacterized metal-binding protein YceD (DUF177 family)